MILILKYIKRAHVMNHQRIEFESKHYCDVVKKSLGTPNKCYVLLHGYGESGEVIYKRFSSLLTTDCLILAPNGPFPMPIRTEDGFKMTFAWYFFDPVKLKFFIDYGLPAQFLKNVFEQLIPKDLPVTIIGYSQGGYLAPFAGFECPNTKQVIGINCGYKYERYPQNISFKINAIHGQEDIVVDPLKAQKEHQHLKELGVHGEFQMIEGEGHRLTKPFLEIIKKLIKTDQF